MLARRCWPGDRCNSMILPITQTVQSTVLMLQPLIAASRHSIQHTCTLPATTNGPVNAQCAHPYLVILVGVELAADLLVEVGSLPGGLRSDATGT